MRVIWELIAVNQLEKTKACEAETVLNHIVRGLYYVQHSWRSYSLVCPSVAIVEIMPAPNSTTSKSSCHLFPISRYTPNIM